MNSQSPKVSAVRVTDSRRVTGASLYGLRPGAVVDLQWTAGTLSESELAILIVAWQTALTRVWPSVFGASAGSPSFVVRHVVNGCGLLVVAPSEMLLPLTDLCEWAVAHVLAPDQFAAPAPEVIAAIQAARLPALDALRAHALTLDLPVLLDDEAITIGTGAGLLQLPREGPLPEVDSIDWTRLRRIPAGIVTGTNGKTTTTRLAAKMLGASGRVVGATSSAGVTVAESQIARGDYSGPEGARLALRHPGVEVALLETARGGILRRGIVLDRVDVAVITNVSADHLGEHGIHDVASMARVKAVVGSVANIVVLGADDPELRALAPKFAGKLVWFGLNPGEPVVAEHVASGNTAWLVDEGEVVRLTGSLRTVLCQASEVACSLGGRAQYNLRNALAAAALAHGLGADDNSIASVLRSFASDSVDNPGRGNLLEINGVTVLLDFGHNPAAIEAVMSLSRALLADRDSTARLLVTLGLPGDRRDQELEAVAHAVALALPAVVCLRDVVAHLRGRELGDVPRVLRRALRTSGVSDEQILLATSELAAVEELLARSRPGDLIAVLLHLDADVEQALSLRAQR